MAEVHNTTTKGTEEKTSVRKNSVRNVFIAFGLMAVPPGLLSILNWGDLSSFGRYVTEVPMLIIAAVILAVFYRSFYDVLVTSYDVSTQKKALTAVSGKVVWCSNSVVTITSGSSYSAPVTGSGGYVAGGGGGGSVSTTVKNVEKARLALFDGGELNIEFNCDPLFSPGNVATIVSRRGQRLAYYNQTTDRWYDTVILPFAPRMAVFVIWLVAAYFGVQAVVAANYMATYSGVGPGSTVFWVLLAMSTAFAAILFKRTKLKAAKDAVISLVRDHDELYAKQVAQSQESWRKMVEDL